MKIKALLLFVSLSFCVFGQINRQDQLFTNKSLSEPLHKINDIKEKGQKFEVPPLLRANEGESNLSTVQELKKKGLKEDINKRDAYAKHFKNQDGSYTAVIAAGPIHYLNEGEWKDIDTKVLQTNHNSHSFINTANILESHFGKTSHLGVISKTDKGEIKEFLNVSMYWEVNSTKTGKVLAEDVSAEVKENKVLYPNIFGEIAAEFIVLTGKRKLNYIIPSKQALGVIPSNAEYLVFSEDIVLPKGWTYSISDKGDVEVKNIEGYVTFTYSKPYVMENYKENEAPLRNPYNPSIFEIVENQNGFTYLVKVEKSWITDNERVFPIAIDPTVYPNNAAYWTGSVDILGLGNNDTLYVGFDGGAEVDGWVRYNLSSIPDNQTISSVISRLYLFGGVGTLNNSRTITIGDCVIDPLTATYFSEIFDGYTQNISISTGLQNLGFRSNAFTATGVAYIQNSLENDFATILAWPSGLSWNLTNYGAFYGYSASIGFKPELVVNYYATPTCNTPSSSSNQYRITNVSFLGTLIPDTSNSTAYSSGGYYSSTTNMATQIPGGVINVSVTNQNNLNQNQNIFVKAWVDWDKNNVFDSSERIYDSGSILIPNTIFGFVVPPGTAPGTYKIRIRTHRATSYFLACGPLSNGETEDYIFTVIEDCPAKITATNINENDGVRCGVGEVQLSASGTGASYRWYNSEYGGSPIPGATGSTFTTNSLPIGTHTFYVTSWNGTCESVYRTPVRAVVMPTPVIEFEQDAPEICGSVESLIVTSSGDVEEVNLIDEKFTSGLGAFFNVVGGNNNSDGVWQMRPSPYIPVTPPYYALKPALTSGHSGGNYAAIITDVWPSTDILNHLTLINNLNTTGFLNLNLDFDLYYYSMIDNELSYGYLNVDYSINGGSSWTTLETYTIDQGTPSKWLTKSLDLPANTLDQTQFKVRFSLFAFGDEAVGWVANIATIDNVRIYGDKPLDTAFDWEVSGVTIEVFDEDCTTPYSGASTTVCVKPIDFENDESWEITATATLSNGCSASGTIEIENKNKVWNTSATNWATLNWKPGTAAPTAEDCVIIRTPVNLTGGTDGVAKNLKLENTGSLSIQPSGSLTVTDFIVNEAAASAFVVESDANLLQINRAENTGEITVKRSANVPSNQYNFWSSPVAGQNMYDIYPNIPNNRVMVYNTETDFYNILSPANTEFGKGYSIKGPSSGGPAVTSEFIGVPHNETLTGFNWIPLVSGVGQGFNLIGNPYPSNLNLQELYNYGSNNTNIEPTFYFWDNVGNTIFHQQGPGYSGINFATYNANFGGATQASGGSGKKPNGIVKPGQGFIVQAIAGSSGIEVNNEMRTTALKIDPSDDDAPYYKNGLIGEFDSQRPMEGKFWLELVNPNNLHIQIALGYFEQADHAFDKYDTPVVNESASDNLYSFSSDAEKLTINGRGPFTVEDVIPLGVGFYVKERYRIQLEDTKGIFVNHQNIYLKDKYLNLIHNLSSSPYEFESLAGEFTDRFEVVFKPEGFTNPAIENQISIARQGSNILVSSSLDKIVQVEVFNLAGWQVYKKDSIMSKEILIPATSFDNQIIVVTVLTEKGEKVSQKLVNK